MQVIPAIDLRSGRAVRLYQGRADREFSYDEHPVDLARNLVAAGAGRLHVIDLDGAFTGSPKNLETVAEIAAVVDVPVQFGGGLRTKEALARASSTGVTEAILGTAAVLDREFVEFATKTYPGRIIVSLDVKGWEVMINGWLAGGGRDLKGVVRELANLEIRRYIYTDIEGDGTLRGTNLRELLKLDVSDVRFMVAGGIGSLDDIARIKNTGCELISGVIIGRALRDGVFSLAEAAAAAGEGW